MNFDNEPDKKKFPPLPAGWYSATIVEAADVESKSSGKPMTSITFECQVQKRDGGTWNKKVFGRYSWHVSKHIADLKAVCKAAGVEPKGKVEPSVLQGRQLEVYLNIEIDPSGKYDDKNIVTDARQLDIPF